MMIKKNILLKKILPDRSAVEIQEFINNNDGMVFHEPVFNKAVSEIFGTEHFYFVIYKNNELVAICPAHSKNKNSLLRITELKPLYDVPYGGFVYDKSKITLQEILKTLKPGTAESLIYYSSPIVKEEDNSYQAINSKRMETAIVGLQASEEDIWNDSVDAKRRNMVRKALKFGITVNLYSSEEGLKLFWPLLEELHKKINSEYLTYEYYKKVLIPCFKQGNAAILLANKNGEVISGVILIGNNYMVHYWKGASKHDVKNEGQGDLLQWEAIKWSKSKGAKYYDLCVVEPERLPQIAMFKLGFSKKIVPFYVFSRKAFVFRVINGLKKYCNNMFLGYYKMRIKKILKQSLIKFKLRYAGNRIQRGASISKDAVLQGGNYVGEYSRIGNKTVLGKNVRIGNNVTLINVKLGNGTTIEDFTLIQGSQKNKIEIGNDTYISSHSTLESTASLKIGNHVSAGPNLRIVTHSGHLQALTEAKIGSPNYIIKKPVIIEDYVYIGVGTIILMGVTIGRFSIVNAGSVVTKSIPAYSFAQGAPAKVVAKVVFVDNKPTIEKL